MLTYSPENLGGRDDDGPGARSVAEPVVEPGPTAGELVATPAAATAVAEADISGRGEAVRVRGIETRGAAVVDRAGTAADVLSAVAAVRDDHVVRRTRGVAVEGLPNERDVGVGRVEPVVELVNGDDVGDLR